VKKIANNYMLGCKGDTLLHCKSCAIVIKLAILTSQMILVFSKYCFAIYNSPYKTIETDKLFTS
jgi:hypothetical protein